jgi:hypothetical protein
MVECLNYLQEKEKMISKFKFFEGVIKDTYVFDNINMTATHVPSGERTLRAQWSPDLADDLNYYHGIDAEAELTRLMSEHIAREMDEEIITTLTRRINGGNVA